MAVELDVAQAVLLRSGEGEAVADLPQKTLLLLVDHEALALTWFRYPAHEDGPERHIHKTHTDAFYVLERRGLVQSRARRDARRARHGGNVRRGPHRRRSHVRQRELRRGDLPQHPRAQRGLRGHAARPTRRSPRGSGSLRPAPASGRRRQAPLGGDRRSARRGRGDPRGAPRIRRQGRARRARGDRVRLRVRSSAPSTRTSIRTRSTRSSSSRASSSSRSRTRPSASGPARSSPPSRGSATVSATQAPDGPASSTSTRPRTVSSSASGATQGGTR